MTRRPHAVVMSRRANADLVEAVEHIARESTSSAAAVERAIRKKLEQIQRFPDSAPIDTDAPPAPSGASARATHASGFVIRYVFPLKRAGRDVLYVISIRRAARLPLDDHEYTIRFLQEARAAYARVETHEPPHERARSQELAAAERWQFQQAWATWQRIKSGTEKLVGPDEIHRTFERALARSPRRRKKSDVRQLTPEPRLPQGRAR